MVRSGFTNTSWFATLEFRFAGSASISRFGAVLLECGHNFNRSSSKEEASHVVPRSAAY